MRVEETAYDVPDWGTGTLWTVDGTVLAHVFDYAVQGERATGGVAAPGSPSPDGRAAGRSASADPSRCSSTIATARVGGAGGAAALRAAPLEGGARPPGVTLEEIPSHGGHELVPEQGRSGPRGEGSPRRASDIVARLVAFFAGADSLAHVPVDLTWCTPFQRDALEALRRVPRGEVVTYGELAALAGRPGAQRAVGTLCAHNRFALLVPCHRVVAADGIGGYGASGVSVKRRLLELEGVHL